MTGAAPPWLEAPTHPAEWFNVDALLPNQYATLWVSTTAGSYVHAFAPLQTIAQGTEEWEEVKQRFDLHCMINFLPAEQITSLTQTARQFFTDAVEGQHIATLHSHLPCFSEQGMGLHTPDALQMDLFVELDKIAPPEAIYPLPDSIIEEFAALSAGPVQPDPAALTLAKSWLENLYHEIKTTEERWLRPHLTVQDGGDVVFEWWKGQKSLSVYASSDEVWFLQSAGSNSEQTEGDADTKAVRRSIWQWLTQ
jgi:hypothetical protein